MRAAALIAFLLGCFLLASCTRTPPPGSPASVSPALPPTDTAVVPDTSAGAAVSYVPSRERVLVANDGLTLGLDWRPLGMLFPAAMKSVRYGYVFANTPLVNRAGTPTGLDVPAGTKVAVHDAGPWVNTEGSYRRLYRVRWGAENTDGWIDGSSLALITAEKGLLAAGVVPRHIVVGGGESDYSLLAIVDRGATSLIDTSTFRFPDSFHPSGVVSVSVADVNGSGSLQVVVDVETIASLTSLGTTPLRWAAWLSPRDGQWAPILLYDEKYATDGGYSFTAAVRAYDDTGASGMKNMVRLDTDYVVVSGDRVFRTRTVSFYAWTGTEYRRDALQDLPQHGTVSAEGLALVTKPGGAERTTALAQGDVVFVFDRADAPPGVPSGSLWYHVVTSSGAEGWLDGNSMSLAWIDPLTENRAVFLGQATPP